jgi:hypothetical protein
VKDTSKYFPFRILIYSVTFYYSLRHRFLTGCQAGTSNKTKKGEFFLPGWEYHGARKKTLIGKACKGSLARKGCKVSAWTQQFAGENPANLRGNFYESQAETQKHEAGHYYEPARVKASPDLPPELRNVTCAP